MAAASVVVATVGLAGCGSHSPDIRSGPARSTRTAVATELEAIHALSPRGLLVAGRTRRSRTTHVWLCPGLSEVTRCRDISPPGMRPSEYVDDFDVDEFGDYWLLTTDAASDRGWIRITRNRGRTWSDRHVVPTHNASGGSQGRLVAFDDRSALVTQFSANGPVALEYRTSDGGLSWRRVFEDHWLHDR